jgi:hypothetical protein
MTTGTANGMAIRDWAFLACRILALYLFYLAIETMLSIGIFIFMTTSADENTRLYGYYYVLRFLLAIASGLVMWFGATRLADWMVPRQAQEPEAEAAGERDVTRLLSLAVAVFGLALLIFAIPDAARLVAIYLAPDRLYAPHLIETAVVATRLVLGLFLILGIRGIANLIGRARGWQAG